MTVYVLCTATVKKLHSLRRS